MKNSPLTISRTIRPGGSSASQRVTATESGCNSANIVRTRCAKPTGGSSQGRHRAERIIAANAAASKGRMIRAADINSFLQRGEPARIERGELAVDVMDDDADDEHTHEQVEQHS